MSLHLMESIQITQYFPCAFDHADLDPDTGTVVVANEAQGCLEVLDAQLLRHGVSIPDCSGASGVLYLPELQSFVGAARAMGRVILVDAHSWQVVRGMPVGPRPNGLAWDGRRRLVLIADVQDHSARLVDVLSGLSVTQTALPGRPRWCLYDAERDLYWVNIVDPALVVGLRGADLQKEVEFPVAAAGPHGLALDEASGRLLVACDAGRLVALDRDTGCVVGECTLAGPPDVVWLNVLRRRLYVAVGDPGCVQAIDLDTYDIVEEIVTEQGAHTLTFDEGRQRLYVFLPKTGQAVVYEETDERNRSHEMD